MSPNIVEENGLVVNLNIYLFFIRNVSLKRKILYFYMDFLTFCTAIAMIWTGSGFLERLTLGMLYGPPNTPV